MEDRWTCPQCELFYQRLMLCYGQLGRPAAVLVTYDRCRMILDHALGIRPSRQTEAVRQQFLANP